MNKNNLLYELNLFVQINDIMYIRGEEEIRERFFEG